MSECPNVMTLNRYASGALERHIADELTHHLTKCERCQSRVDQMAEQPDTLVQVARRTKQKSQNAGGAPQLAQLIADAQQFAPGDESTADIKDGNNASVTLPEKPAEKVKHRIADLDSFIVCLRKSRLVDELEVDRLVSSSESTTTEDFAEELVRENVLTHYQAKILSRGRWKGLILGNYVIQEKLGQGGMGQVFKARHQRMGRVVCIKVLRALGRKSPEIVERFRREIKAISSLNHPNFVIAHDADEDEGIQFLVMEYIDGSDLSRLVKKYGPRPVNDSVEMIRQAARALEYAHQQGVIHRDIKPHNLLLTSDDEDEVGLVKVLDMGLARFDNVLGADSDSNTQASMTATGVIMGTVDYISPEQALNSRNADGRSDIYSLGCTLHYLMTGQPLFPGQTIMEKLINHRELDPPRLKDSVPETPVALDAIFAKMVAKEPAERYASMTELADDLEALQDGRRPKALASWWLALWDGFKNNPWPAVISGAAVFLIGLAVWSFASRDDDSETYAANKGTPQDEMLKVSKSAKQDKDDSNGGWGPGDKPLDQLMQQLRNANSSPNYDANSSSKVIVLVPHKGFSQQEVDKIKMYLTKNNFYPVLASSQPVAYSKPSGKKIKLMNFSKDYNPRDYFGVLVANVGKDELKSLPIGKMKQSLQSEGVVAGVGLGAGSLSALGFCDGQCVHPQENIKIDLEKKTKGSVILADVKYMEQVARYMKKLHSSSEY